MLRVLLILIPIFLITCSKDKPVPVGPASKITSSLDAPGKPNNLRVEVLSDSSARVSWDAVENATDYDLYYRKLKGRWINSPHIGTRLYNIIYNLEPETEYRWVVRAKNKDGASAWIFGTNFTTPALQEINSPSIAGELSQAVIDTNDSFEIDVVFVHKLDRVKKDWVLTVAAQWEPFFQDQLYGIEKATQDTIDDLRVYIDTRTIQDHQPLSNSGGSVVLGRTRILQWREGDNLPLTAVVYINEAQIEVFAESAPIKRQPRWKETFHHELGHVFGIGSSPGWLDNITWRRQANSNNQLAYYTGSNAVREYQDRNVDGHPRYIRSDGIFLGMTNFGAKETPIHFNMMSGMHHHLFSTYYLRENDSPNICRVALGVFNDIGWSVNYDRGQAMYQEEFHLTPCWLVKQREGDFHLCDH